MADEMGLGKTVTPIPHRTVNLTMELVTMHHITLDIASSISHSATTNHSEMYHRVSLLSRQKLGQRTR